MVSVLPTRKLKSNLTVSEVIELVKMSVSVEDVASHYAGIKVAKRSGKVIMSCCPFHTENTPSFAIYFRQGKYKCFGCGEYGDVINFVAKYEKVSLARAAYKIAEDFNLIKASDDAIRSQLANLVARKEEWQKFRVREKTTYDCLQRMKSLFEEEVKAFKTIEEVESKGYYHDYLLVTNCYMDLMDETNPKHTQLRIRNVEEINNWIEKKLLPVLKNMMQE